MSKPQKSLGVQPWIEKYPGLKQELENAQILQKKAIDDIKSHLEADIQLQQISFAELSENLSGAVINVADLCTQLQCLMPSFLGDHKWEDKAICNDFMAQILYTVGPESRSVKAKRDTDKYWVFRTDEVVNVAKAEDAFNKRIDALNTSRPATNKLALDTLPAEDDPAYDEVKGMIDTTAYWKTGLEIRKGGGPENEKADANAKFIQGWVIVSTYKSSTAPSGLPKVKSHTLRLTLRQASILALMQLEKYNELACVKDKTVLTPLAGAIFSKQSILDMMKDTDVRRIFKTECDLINCINASAQSGGQYLNNSRLDMAAACAIAATTSVKDTKERRSIVHKTVKQFTQLGRAGTNTNFMTFAKYASGGVPSDWEFEKILREFVDARLDAQRRKELEKASEAGKKKDSKAGN